MSWGKLTYIYSQAALYYSDSILINRKAKTQLHLLYQ